MESTCVFRVGLLSLINSNLCDSSYVGYTRQHLFQRINEIRYSAVGKHFRESHNLDRPNMHEQFNILKKC